MKILVTGGAGFIGSNFIRLLLNKTDYEIINFDKLTYAGNLDNLRDIENNNRYKFIKGDICCTELLNDIFQTHKPNIIVNFAAESHVDRSISSPDEFINANFIGVYKLLEVSKQYDIKLFLQVSTDEVYGSIKHGFADENYPLVPSSPYSASKTSGELLAMSYYITYKLPVIVSRCSNNYGPYQYPEKLIPSFIINLLENKKVPLYGDGLNRRDWIYVLDHCEAILFLIENGKAGEIYNIAGNNEKTNVQITNFILKELNKDDSFIKYVQDRPGHDRRYAIDDKKIRELGFRNKYSFESAMIETVMWYRDNSEWWKKLKVKSI